MKIALVQMDVVHGQPVENKKHVIGMLERALDDNPDVIVLPEMWNTGYVTLCMPTVQVPSLAWLTCTGRRRATSLYGKVSLRMLS